MLNLPHQTAINRSRPIDPITIPDPGFRPGPDGKVLHILYGPLPGDPAHVLRPLVPVCEVRCSRPISWRI